MSEKLNVGGALFTELAERHRYFDRYLGVDEESGSPRELHLIREVLTPQGGEELRRTSIILGQIEHPSLVRPLAFGKLRGRVYLIYEPKGTPLSKLDTSAGLSPKDVLTIGLQVLEGLLFAESKGVEYHGNLHPDFIHLDLDQGQVRLSHFKLLDEFRQAGKEEAVKDPCLDPLCTDYVGYPKHLLDLYALGIIMLSLVVGRPVEEVREETHGLEAEAYHRYLSAISDLPLPLREAIYKLTTPDPSQRYRSFEVARDVFLELAGGDEARHAFEAFIFSTHLGGRYRLGEELKGSSVFRVYEGRDVRSGEPVIVKVVSLRDHPELVPLFKSRLRSLPNLEHPGLLKVHDVGIHFEHGYLVYEHGGQNLEDVLIRRSKLPLRDVLTIAYSINETLDWIHSEIGEAYGGLKPTNIFLSPDLSEVKLADLFISRFLVEHGNLNETPAEYFNPELAQDKPQAPASDFYTLGVIVFEMLVGHAPFTLKLEQEIIHDHLHTDPGGPIEDALISVDAKALLYALLEKNPRTRINSAERLREELRRLLGWHREVKVEVPPVFFDFADLCMVGKNARERNETTFCLRLPSADQKPRGVAALARGEGGQVGQGQKLAEIAASKFRELILHPSRLGGEESVRLSREEPEEFLKLVLRRVNEECYRYAFQAGILNRARAGLGFVLIQEGTLYAGTVGPVRLVLLHQGEVVDPDFDKTALRSTLIIGGNGKVLAEEAKEALAQGEVFKVDFVKKLNRDGDQLLLVSEELSGRLSVSELRELMTSTDDPNRAMELLQSEAMRRRFPGTISAVLVNVGRVRTYATTAVSHAKRGTLARSFLYRGNSFLNEGDADNAIRQYEQALEINPGFAIIHLQLGRAYLLKGLEDRALACFFKAIELNAKLGPAYVEAVEILRRKRRLREADELLARGWMKGLSDPDALAIFAQLRMRQRDFKTAYELLSTAREREPENPRAVDKSS